MLQKILSIINYESIWLKDEHGFDIPNTSKGFSFNKDFNPTVKDLMNLLEKLPQNGKLQISFSNGDGEFSDALYLLVEKPDPISEKIVSMLSEKKYSIRSLVNELDSLGYDPRESSLTILGMLNSGEIKHLDDYTLEYSQST